MRLINLPKERPMPTQVSDAPGSIAEAEIRALIDSIHQAHLEKNAEALGEPYTQDAVIFDLSPPLAHRGIAVEPTQPWLDSWATPIELESRDLEITASGGFAFGHSFLRMRGIKKFADRPVDFWMRETFCCERKADGWRIVHEHISVPFLHGRQPSAGL
jgi:ketosteroid isomerase-like protein